MPRAAAMGRKRAITRRVRLRRSGAKTRAFDDIFEDDEREVPIGGDDKPPAGE